MTPVVELLRSQLHLSSGVLPPWGDPKTAGGKTVIKCPRMGEKGPGISGKGLVRARGAIHDFLHRGA